MATALCITKLPLVTTPYLDRITAIILCFALTPLWLLNAIVAISSGRDIYELEEHTDALGRPLVLRRFSAGIAPGTLYLLAIVSGRLAFVGISLRSAPGSEVITGNTPDVALPPGLVSLYGIQRKVGLCEQSHAESIYEQQACDGTLYRFKLLLRGLLTQVLYGRTTDHSPNVFRLFGVPINNIRMSDAVEWICADRQASDTRLAYFVNVNSFNIVANDASFGETLAQADRVFADGSGVRIAAAQAGYRLQDNVNGTDLLPPLCARLAANHKSLFLLGADPGVADEAANNLRKQFPGLVIAGTQHGYFNPRQEAEVIQQVNASGADVLLVAMGSPLQEKWLDEHRADLQVPCALAVGGLLDFYAGSVSRAPRWLRELGLEWVWRLLQEPSRMWRRYILGNPLFLYRTYFCRKELLK